jgi:ribosome modulation factor
MKKLGCMKKVRTFADDFLSKLSKSSISNSERDMIRMSSEQASLQGEKDGKRGLSVLFCPYTNLYQKHAFEIIPNTSGHVNYDFKQIQNNKFN